MRERPLVLTQTVGDTSRNIAALWMPRHDREHLVRELCRNFIITLLERGGRAQKIGFRHLRGYFEDELQVADGVHRRLVRRGHGDHQ